MADNNGAAQGGASEAKRPSISLPPSSTVENLFRVEPAEASPGPMTLVSSFFAEDSESECRSFSQLLAGAMASPSAKTSAEVAPLLADGRGRGGGLNLGHSRPMNLLVAQSPFFTVPPGLSPGGLLDSPAMFSSNLGQFGLSHQQASHSQLQMNFLSENRSPFSSAFFSQSIPTMKISKALQIPSMSLDTNNHKSDDAISARFDQSSHPTAIVVDKPANDGYNWRKYGQKQVKGSEFPRSYYKCTHPNCPVKKKVERSLDGQVTEIIYKGKHSHPKPLSNKRGKDGNMLTGSADSDGHNAFLTNSESLSQGDPSNVSRSSNGTSDLSKRERESGHELLLGLSDGEEMGDHDGEDEEEDEEDCSQPNQKRRNMEAKVTDAASHRTVTEARIIVQTTSEVDLLDDGYRWRKYGQKVVKGNPHPRSYYKCTSIGCNVRKHVERASKDPKAVITTYEGKHNHDVPAARNSIHNTSVVAASNSSKNQNIISTSQNIHGRSDVMHDVHRPIAVLQLKEEHEHS
ncbi:putative WRKY transcription factor 4 [Platanthera zijinensis]|uniref:WRKY transcription factor 4 n=1 Tax=Platanthera zijinensis TaxID=2320716 RepID=A0AAP0BX86_9ASPA